MPAFLEQKLKKEYGAGSSIPYRIMNEQGYMKGNQETPKGAAAAEAHKGAAASAHLRRSALVRKMQGC